MSLDPVALALDRLPPDQPVLIAGPTASGKSALALRIAESQGGVIINADASQVYDCWRIITACPSEAEEARAPHVLYRHVPWRTTYSTGTWLREVTPFLSEGLRPIIVGGTGLYFSALTEGMADIPPVTAEIRAEGDAMRREEMLAALDSATLARIDTANRARVQRAWEVLRATGRGLADWQDDTPDPVLAPTSAARFVLDAPKEWLEPRIRRRIDLMIDGGALDEVRAMLPYYDPALPAFRAIGVPELAAYLSGDVTLDEARERMAIATRQFAKRQRTWFRARMRDWGQVSPDTLT
ncbi:MAG: tRNA (adenosine(37)-N6)-dimethylallyltransferase MiaA [Paracoccaceae bacterium]